MFRKFDEYSLIWNDLIYLFFVVYGRIFNAGRFSVVVVVAVILSCAMCNESQKEILINIQSIGQFCILCVRVSAGFLLHILKRARRKKKSNECQSKCFYFSLTGLSGSLTWLMQ